jgi:hypothetical protein
MAQTKWAHDFMMDQSLTWVKTTATKMSVCSTCPTNKLQANTTYCIAYTVMAAGDFTLGDGVTSGRKNAVAAKANLAVNTTKSAYHIALYADPGTYLCYVTTCATQALTSGNTVTVPTWNIEIRDPA